MADALAALQARLQQDIITGDTACVPLLSVPAEATPEKRLFVYQNAYISRLIEFLCEDYDTTWTFLGDALFYDLARKYAELCPSHTPNARWFGHGFPEFLLEQEVSQTHPVIPDIARIERALGDAFDAADTPPLRREDLAALAQTGIENAALGLHPSVALLRLETNAYDIFNALRGDQTPPAPQPEDESRWLLIWRKELTCRHLELPAEQGALLDMARHGASFERLCEISATLGDPDTAALRMAGYLNGWIENELITTFA